MDLNCALCDKNWIGLYLFLVLHSQFEYYIDKKKDYIEGLSIASCFSRRLAEFKDKLALAEKKSTVLFG